MLHTYLHIERPCEIQSHVYTGDMWRHILMPAVTYSLQAKCLSLNGQMSPAVLHNPHINGLLLHGLRSTHLSGSHTLFDIHPRVLGHSFPPSEIFLCALHSEPFSFYIFQLRHWLHTKSTLTFVFLRLSLHKCCPWDIRI